MFTTTIRTMLNAEPHHFEAEFDKPYAEITADDVLEKATKFLMDYTAAYGVQELPEDLKNWLSLRYITQADDAFRLTSAPDPGSPLSENFPSTYSTLATEWYRTTGFNLSSVPVDPVSLLASKAASPDETRVRWYIILLIPEPSFPTAHYIPNVLYGLIFEVSNQRKDYLQILKRGLDERKETKIPSPSKVGKDTSSYHSNATVYIGDLPQSAYGPNPAIFEPIFAEAYNSLQHPKLVELERGTRGGANHTFDIIQWLTKFREACLRTNLGKHNFNVGVIQELQKLIPFLELEPHIKIYDDKGAQAAELGWRGTCVTAHGLRCLVVGGEGREKFSEGGNPMTQVFLTIQRMLALNPEFASYMKLTCCPAVIMTVVGNRVNVWLMCFTDKIYGSELFAAYLGPTFGFSSHIERNDLAVKFQVVRNVVKKLCNFYANLHGWTLLPSVPHYFPQPLPLLRCLLPSPSNEVVRRLASLRLIITTRIPSLHDPARCLFKGYSYASGKRSRVCVKLVMSTYGEDAHRLLAKQDPPLAPQLLWCGEIICGKTLVVMEALQQAGIDEPLHPRKGNEEDIGIIERDIGQALDILHAHGFVHGDVRDPNMVITRKRGYLLDFDSAGEVGVARYPDTLNSKIAWPEPVESLVSMPIKISDDKWRLKRTLGELRGSYDDNQSSSSSKRDRQDDSGVDERSLKRSRSDNGSGGMAGLSQDFPGVVV